MTTPAAAYHARFRKVLDYIDAHLEGDLPVERLSRVASSSKYHFHRQFSGLFGVAVSEYVKLVRLKRASYELAFREGRRILEIALGSGYESPEAFARAFKKRFGQTPTAFREQPDWQASHAVHGPLHTLRSEHMKSASQEDRVRVTTFDETKVGVLEHRGDPARIGDTIRTFIEWRKASGLGPRVSATFNLLYGDPHTTPPEEFRLDLCAAAPRGVPENAFGVVERTIPGGRCAVLRHVGSDDNLADSFRYLYSQWLPASGEELRDFPLFLQRLALFPDVPEHEAIVDIFLPLK